MMEDVIDKLVSEVETLAQTLTADGGISDVVTVEAVYWGDPIVVPVNLYPCFTVAPVVTHPKGETTGYEMKDLSVTVTFLIDARAYFEASTDENQGDRIRVKVADAVDAWLRRSAKRKLDGLAGVREVTVGATSYSTQPRGSVLAKSATVSLTVNRSRPRQP